MPLRYAWGSKGIRQAADTLKEYGFISAGKPTQPYTQYLKSIFVISCLEFRNPIKTDISQECFAKMQPGNLEHHSLTLSLVESVFYGSDRLHRLLQPTNKQGDIPSFTPLSTFIICHTEPCLQPRKGVFRQNHAHQRNTQAKAAPRSREF